MFSNFRNSELGILALALEEEDKNWRRKEGRRKRKWVLNTWKSRPVEGEFYTLLPHLMDDETKFYEYFRMAQSTFNDLLKKLKDSLKKEDTFWRLSITPKQRLAVCLRYVSY